MKNIYKTPVAELALIELEDILTLSFEEEFDFGNADGADYGSGKV